MSLRCLVLLCLAVSGVAATEAGELKVVSYNLYEGMAADASPGKEAFAAWVRRVNPDVLAMQEVQHFTPKELEALARRYGHPYAVLLKEDGYPVALTSRYPMEDVRRVTENMHHGYIHAKIAGIHFLVVHLSPHKYVKRREEVETLLGLVRAAPATERWIILGDFNSEARVDAVRHDHAKVAEGKRLAALKYPQHDNLVDGKLDYAVVDRLLAAGFIDVVNEAAGPVGALPTRPTKFLAEGHTAAPARIDFIFASANIGRRTGAGVLRDAFTDITSDHYPVWLTLTQ